MEKDTSYTAKIIKTLFQISRIGYKDQTALTDHINNLF